MGEVQPIITTQVARSIISLVDYCYRLGVFDAYEVGDEGLAREYLGEVSKVGVYGFLNDDFQAIDWEEWMLRLLAGARNTSWRSVMASLYSMVGKRPNNSYIGAFVPISQMFYAKGVRDYSNYSNSCNIEVFRGRTKTQWTARGLISFSIPRYADEIQLACYDLARRDEKAIEEAESKIKATKSGALIRRQYERFIRAVSLAIAKTY